MLRNVWLEGLRWGYCGSVGRAAR